MFTPFWILIAITTLPIVAFLVSSISQRYAGVRLLQRNDERDRRTREKAL